MDSTQLKGKWHQVKGAVKAKWGELTDDEVLQVEGDAERLSGLIQERYGYTKERAREEVDAFFGRDDLYS